jgi:hypothetical protein
VNICTRRFILDPLGFLLYWGDSPDGYQHAFGIRRTIAGWRIILR